MPLLCAKDTILDSGNTTASKMNLIPAFMELAYILLKADGYWTQTRIILHSTMWYSGEKTEEYDMCDLAASLVCVVLTGKVKKWYVNWDLTKRRGKA